MARPTILLNRDAIGQTLDFSAALLAVERAMAAFEDGHDYLPPKAIYQLPLPNAWAACITGYTQASHLLTMKVGQERTGNLQRNLPTTSSWILAFDPDTGELLMICDGTLPTMVRTAAAAAVAIQQLARPDARTLAVIGAGQLGRQCARAASIARRFERVFIHDVSPAAAPSAIAELRHHIAVPLEACDAQSACSQADVIVTATNSRQPIVRDAWIRPGTHLSCMGADLHEKIECEPTLLIRCQLWADQVEHCLQRGEASQAVEQGILPRTCYVGTLGQLIRGRVPGRTDPQQITLFDGVGIGIQDTAITRTLYDQAVQHQLGTAIAFS